MKPLALLLSLTLAAPAAAVDGLREESTPFQSVVVRSGDTARVSGLLRIGDNGEFSVVLKTRVGANSIHIVVTDGEGNESRISRHVARM